MSLLTVNTVEIVKKQFLFKLKANIDAFSSLVWIQLLAMLFSLGGVATQGFHSDGLSISIKYFSSDMVIVFTMIWGLVTAITITTKPYRYFDFSFVTNRATSSLANIIYLFAASVIGGVTAMLAKGLLIIIGYFFLDFQLLDFYSQPVHVRDFMIGIVAAVLYIFFISSIGYFIGTLVQVSKLFIVGIPVLFIGSMFLDGMMQREPIAMKTLQFYFVETSLFLFTIKILISTALFFAASISILNRMEVRK
ncbi:hypothetical protein [Niallia endozanthoxylica]|uniref:Uncharacterized protein n=1 Tax=Niallia endozanthoxylica TaxID=2036016 RepID=A0A5J5HGU2_9BACI|nr:hypothetical protein [Niallia endozanthoxylica]KAA9019481.1 hypothetical protein F4V44_19215 [Niallia endozanthoxylica]